MNKELMDFIMNCAFVYSTMLACVQCWSLTLKILWLFISTSVIRACARSNPVDSCFHSKHNTFVRMSERERNTRNQWISTSEWFMAIVHLNECVPNTRTVHYAHKMKRHKKHYVSIVWSREAHFLIFDKQSSDWSVYCSLWLIARSAFWLSNHYFPSVSLSLSLTLSSCHQI